VPVGIAWGSRAGDRSGSRGFERRDLLCEHRLDGFGVSSSCFGLPRPIHASKAVGLCRSHHQASGQVNARKYGVCVGGSRFLQTDPIPGGSANNYDYVNQDPVNGSDLNGMAPCGGGASPNKRVRRYPSWFGWVKLLCGNNNEGFRHIFRTRAERGPHFGGNPTSFVLDYIFAETLIHGRLAPQFSKGNQRVLVLNFAYMAPNGRIAWNFQVGMYVYSGRIITAWIGDPHYDSCTWTVNGPSRCSR
jgi:hypothetical protein